MTYMGKSQRVKGASFEREVAKTFAAALHCEVKRKLGQARDGGDDIAVGPYRIECKRRARIAVYKWMQQVERAAGATDIPLVVMRADNEEPLVLMHLRDFLDLEMADSP